MFTLRITILITFIVPLNYELCFCHCSHAEYEIERQCCPMCAPGNHVLWHCTDDTSTTCVPCPEFTYIDEPSGLTKCLPCTACDANRGLRVNKACTRSSDTECGPLERFFCSQKQKGTCILALQHSQCSPGQYIKQAGTDSSDTVCADCQGDTYSNGSFSSCLPHTKCEAMRLTETHPGTRSSDRECGNPPSVLAGTVSSVVLVTLIIITGGVFMYLRIHKKKKKKQSKCSGIQETRRLKCLNANRNSKDVGDSGNTQSFGSGIEIL